MDLHVVEGAAQTPRVTGRSREQPLRRASHARREQHGEREEEHAVETKERSVHLCLTAGEAKRSEVWVRRRASQKRRWRVEQWCEGSDAGEPAACDTTATGSSVLAVRVCENVLLQCRQECWESV